MLTWKPLLVCALVALPLAPQQEPPEPITIPGGFYTADTFRNLKSGKPNYVAGYIDGMLASRALMDTSVQIPKIRACLAGMNAGQLEALMDKYIADHPERWDNPMSGVGLFAVVSACRSRGFDLTPQEQPKR